MTSNHSWDYIDSSSGFDRLRREVETFKRLRPHLLAIAHGKFVLIHGDDLAGTYDSEAEAYDVGHKRFGATSSFLVAQVLCDDEMTIPLPFITLRQ